MPQPSDVTPQLAALRLEWPLTTRELEETFFQRPTWAVTYDGHRNDAGYILWGLRQYASLVNDLHAHHNYQICTLDRAAANEVAYLWDRKAQFRRAAAALVKCFRNIAIERPEKIAQAQRGNVCRHSPAVNTSPVAACGSSTETPSRSQSRLVPEYSPASIGSVLAASTQPKCTPSRPPQQSRLSFRFPVFVSGSSSSSSPGAAGQIRTGGS